MDRNREKEGARMQCFMKNEDKSLIDVEKVLPSELTNTIAQFIVYIHRNEEHFTYVSLHHSNVFEADNIYKNPPQMSFLLYFFALFISLCGSTHDSADPQLLAIPAAAIVSVLCFNYRNRCSLISENFDCMHTRVH